MKILTTLLTALSLSLAMPALTSCSGDDEIPTPPQPEEVAQHTIGINAEAAGFTRAATISDIEKIKANGFTIYCIDNYYANLTGVSLGFADHCTYADGEWGFENGPHIWPIIQSTPNMPYTLDFYAFFAPNGDEDITPSEYADLGSYPSFIFKKQDGSVDVMAASYLNASYTDENEGRIDIDFHHITTQLSVKLALTSSKQESYSGYSAEVSITGEEYLNGFNFYSKKWEHLDDGTSFQYPNNTYAFNGSVELNAADETVIGETLFVIPQNYDLTVNCYGHNGTEKTLIKTGTTTLNLADTENNQTMGKNVVVKLSLDLHSDEITIGDTPNTSLDAPEIRISEWE